MHNMPGVLHFQKLEGLSSWTPDFFSLTSSGGSRRQLPQASAQGGHGLCRRRKKEGPHFHDPCGFGQKPGGFPLETGG